MRGFALLTAAAAHGRSLPATFEPLAPGSLVPPGQATSVAVGDAFPSEPTPGWEPKEEPAATEPKEEPAPNDAAPDDLCAFGRQLPFGASFVIATADRAARVREAAERLCLPNATVVEAVGRPGWGLRRDSKREARDRARGGRTAAGTGRSLSLTFLGSTCPC